MWSRILFILSKVWVFIQPAVKVLASQIGQIVLGVAINTVTNISVKDLTNSEKREEAFNTIKKDLKEKGYEAADSMINLAIETAVAKLKEGD